MSGWEITQNGNHIIDGSLDSTCMPSATIIADTAWEGIEYICWSPTSPAGGFGSYWSNNQQPLFYVEASDVDDF